MKRRTILSILAGLSLSTSAAVAQDVAAGEEIYQGVCRTCHGPNAQGLGSFPKLAGAEEDYLVDRLETYRAGEKVGPNSALMIPHAAELSDEDIANIAGYIVATFP
jgi:cytochrome c553